MADVHKIQAAIVQSAQPGVTSKELHKQIMKAFPKASKKEIRLAAFGAMISLVDKSPDEALQIQDVAISNSDTTTPQDQ